MQLERPQIILLRLEGLVAFALGLIIFSNSGTSWWVFAALILAPDVSFVGYSFGNRWGASLYNLAHTYSTAALVLAAGYATDSTMTVAIGAVWVTHIGMDRAVGYGLKGSNGFKPTHLSWGQ